MLDSTSVNDIFEKQIESVSDLLEHYGLGERNFKRVALNQASFSNVALAKADFSNSSLKNVKLDRVDLRQAIFRGADLGRSIISSSNLSRANLQGVNLEHASINDANLRNANLVRANLSQASLRTNNLQGANLEQALLKGADLAETNLQDANLTQANLAKANLVGTNLKAVNLDRTILTDALYSVTTRFPKGFDPVEAGMKMPETDISSSEQLLSRYQLGERNFKRISLTGAFLGKADLRGADFSGADLTKADFRYANLQGVILKGANLGYSLLMGANLAGVDLRGANLSHIQFKQGSLAGAKLGRANFRGANLANTDLSGASLEQASLRGTNLSDTTLSLANLSNANLAEANLTRANLTQVNLCGAELSVATLDKAIFKDALYDSNTSWPRWFDPVSVGGKSVDRSDGDTVKQTFASSASPVPPIQNRSSDRTIRFPAGHMRIGNLLKGSFFAKPAIYLPFVLFSAAILGGGGYSISRILQSGSTFESEFSVSSPDIFLGESDEVPSSINIVFGNQPPEEIADELLQKEMLVEIGNRQTGDTDELLDTIAVAGPAVSIAEPQKPSPEAEAAFAQQARESFARNDWLGTVEAVSQIENPAIVESLLPMVDRAYHNLAHEAEDRGEWQIALDYANRTITEEGKIQTAPMVQRLEAAIAELSQSGSRAPVVNDRGID